jgi:hypothetical protein
MIQSMQNSYKVWKILKYYVQKESVDFNFLLVI